MLKLPLLNGSAMLALLGTLSSTWCSWDLLCHVQCVFAGPFEDRMLGGFVVAKLYVWCGENGFKQDRFYNSCPGFKKVNERL